MVAARAWANRISIAFCVALACTGAAIAAEGIIEAPVPIKMIYTGQAITPDMLSMRRFRASALRYVNYLATPQDAAGKVARTTLVPNRPIDQGQLRAPWLIEASRPVRMYFRSNGVVIGAEAIPLQSAHAGEIIPARNRATGRVISGLVLPDGTLEVVSAQ